MKDKKDFTRREFIKTTTAAALGGTLLLNSPGYATTTKSKVILVRQKNVLDKNGTPVYDVILEMLDNAVTALTGKKDPGAAWKTLIKPADIVGIKSNVWRYLPTPKQVEMALRERVLDVGVKKENIDIDDRNVKSSAVFQKATALINARPMRSHHWSGVGSLIKNYITFYHKGYQEYHPDSCADLATLWELPLVKNKTRLNVLVMLTPQFHSSGPHGFHPKYLWKYYGLLVGVDPVAVDATGLRIIEAIRKDHFKEDRPLSPPAKHIALADTRHSLGTANPANIELIKIGYDKDCFI